MSLDIRIDGLSVELATGSRLALSLNNPHFDYAKMAGSTANLPPFPLTRRNQYIFDYWEQPQAGPILQRRRLEQYYNGHLIREAVLLLTEAGPNGYVGQMVEPLGEFFGDWQNRSLTELDLMGAAGTLPLPSVVPAEGIAADGMTAIGFPTIVNPDYYGTAGNGISYTGRVNDFSGGAGPNTPARPLVPMVMLNWLLKRIAMATNTTIDGAFLNHPAYSKLLFYNTRALDGATTVVPNQHLPALTVAELLLELRKLFNLRLDFDLVTRTLTIGFWGDAIAKPAVLDWSRKAVGRPLKTPEPNTRLQLGYDLDGNDALMKDKPALLADYLSPGMGGTAALKSRISTLLTDTVSGRIKAAQPGITAQFGQLNNTFSPRLLFWNGIIAGEPDASSSKGFHSLYWNGAANSPEDGLYDNHWRGLEAMRQQQFYAKQQFALTETDLAQLNFGEKVHSNGVDYFVLSVDVSLPIQQPATCLLVAA